MSRTALVRKELYDLVLERRLLLTLLLFSAIFSLALWMMVRQSGHSTTSPMEFLEMLRYVGPVLVGLLAVVLAGDAVARERQDRTLHLLFTAPATWTRYWTALVVAHGVAFGVLAVLLLLFSLLAGAAMGWVAVKGVALLLALALLPLFATLDLAVMALSARLSSGRTSLLLALVLVLALWTTSLDGPFGWALRNVTAWQYISLWHPFDLAATTAGSLLDRGLIAWTPFWKALVEAALAAGIAWTSAATKEVGR